MANSSIISFHEWRCYVEESDVGAFYNDYTRGVLAFIERMRPSGCYQWTIHSVFLIEVFYCSHNYHSK